MSETERQLLEKSDSLKLAHAEGVKLAHRLVAQLSDVRAVKAFAQLDMELVESLVRQLHARQDEVVGLQRDIRDLNSRAVLGG